MRPSARGCPSPMQKFLMGRMPKEKFVLFGPMRSWIHAHTLRSSIMRYEQLRSIICSMTRMTMTLVTSCGVTKSGILMLFFRVK